MKSPDHIDNKTDEIPNLCSSSLDCDTKNEYSEYAYLYKAPLGQKISQNERRKMFLEAIKEARNQAFDDNRKLEEVFDDESDCLAQEELMDVDKKVTSKKKKSHRCMLTYSEWFYEIPDDLEENWLVKFCPFGSRSLVITRQHKTMSYNRTGRLMSKFTSLLPGGGSGGANANKFTILDCIFNKKTRSYHVLDVIAWNNTFVNLKNCDTEFRFYWLKSKFEENPRYGVSSDCNKYPFQLIDCIQAIPTVIESKLNEIILMSCDKTVSIDGILFYHKQSAYVSGYTPLVTWLKPYMLPEMLNIQIDSIYEEKKPENYTSLNEYLKKVTRFNRMHRTKFDDEMETERTDKTSME